MFKRIQSVFYILRFMVFVMLNWMHISFLSIYVLYKISIDILYACKPFSLNFVKNAALTKDEMF